MLTTQASGDDGGLQNLTQILLFQGDIPVAVVSVDKAIESAYSNFSMQRRQSASPAKITRRASSHERLVAALICLGIVLLFGGLWGLQKLHFDFGRVFDPCGFKQRTGYPCPACGMTTSVLAFARGDIFGSFYAQPASAFICSVLVVVVFLASLTAIFGVYFIAVDRVLSEIKTVYWVIALLVILAAGWAVTLARAYAARI
jgi:hypothetical protein